MSGNEFDGKHHNESGSWGDAQPDNTEDTLVRQPKTEDVREHVSVRPTFRYGELYLGQYKRLALVCLKSKRPPIHVDVQHRLVLGRSHPSSPESPDVSLNGYGAQAYGVSRQHAAILRKVDMFQIVDLGSTNGTYLNGHRLEPHQPRILRDGDHVQLGLLAIAVYFLSDDQPLNIDSPDESDASDETGGP